jgi:hypothetical protein
VLQAQLAKFYQCYNPKYKNMLLKSMMKSNVIMDNYLITGVHHRIAIKPKKLGWRL